MLVSYQNWQAISPEHSLLVRLITFIILELIPIILVAAIIGLFIFFTVLSRKNKTLLMEQVITLDENFLVCQSEYARSEVKWEAVQRVVCTRNHLFLYLSAQGAMLIPKRAFDSKEQRDKFVEFCVAKSRAR